MNNLVDIVLQADYILPGIYLETSYLEEIGKIPRVESKEEKTFRGFHVYGVGCEVTQL